MVDANSHRQPTWDPKELSDREFFTHAAKRIGIYVVPPDLRGVTNFLHGYDAAAGRYGRPLLDGFGEWLRTNYVGHHTSFGWPGYIEEIAVPERDYEVDRTPEQEARILETLFELLDKFLAERESAGQSEPG